MDDTMVRVHEERVSIIVVGAGITHPTSIVFCADTVVTLMVCCGLFFCLFVIG